jgi:hypothetical protein
MSLGPTQAHERLDALGVLAESHGPATYGLRVAVPDAVDAVQRRWLETIDAPLPDAYAEQLALADTALYVGRSGDAYARVMDHCRGDVRRASFVRAFDVRDVAGVWPDDANTGVAERNRARALAGGRTVCWTDGELF